MMDKAGSGVGSGPGSGVGSGLGSGLGFTIGVTGFSVGLHEKLTDSSNSALKNGTRRFIPSKYKKCFLNFAMKILLRTLISGEKEKTVNMKYDFDKVVNRRGSDSYKWDSDPDPQMLPMWVADMDFKVAPKIIDDLKKRVEHGVFGYEKVPQSYYESVCSWFRRRHGWQIAPSSIIYTIGVVPALSAIIKALVPDGGKVLVQTPVYNCFFSSIKNNGCEVISSPLRKVELQGEFTYEMDYEDFERKCSEAKLFILCNPHNPPGRVWRGEELLKIREICRRHSVMVVSDEIHCELVMPGYEYVPYATIDPQAIICISASKSFNIAGLQIANIVCPDTYIRSKIDRAININEVCDVNPFGVVATRAAYDECEDWIEELDEYIFANYKYMKQFQREFLPAFPIAHMEGTYLAWMDCSSLGMTSKVLDEGLREKAKLHLNTGTMYGAEGEGFMRWNLACPRVLLQEGLNRFKEYIDSVIK